MQPAVTIGLDIAKSAFQVHGVGATGDVVVRRRLSRGKVLQFFAKIPVCPVGLEACGQPTTGAENSASLAMMPA